MALVSVTGLHLMWGCLFLNCKVLFILWTEFPDCFLFHYFISRGNHMKVKSWRGSGLLVGQGHVHLWAQVPASWSAPRGSVRGHAAGVPWRGSRGLGSRREAHAAPHRRPFPQFLTWRQQARV